MNGSRVESLEEKKKEAGIHEDSHQDIFNVFLYFHLWMQYWLYLKISVCMWHMQRTYRQRKYPCFNNFTKQSSKCRLFQNKTSSC